MKVVFFFVGVGVIAYLQIGSLIKKSDQQILTKDVIVYMSFMIFIFILGSLLLLGIKPPSPILPYQMFFENVGRKLLGE